MNTCSNSRIKTLEQSLQISIFIANFLLGAALDNLKYSEAEDCKHYADFVRIPVKLTIEICQKSLLFVKWKR